MKFFLSAILVYLNIFYMLVGFLGFYFFTVFTFQRSALELE